METNSPSSVSPPQSRKQQLTLVIALVLVTLTAALIFFYTQWRATQNRLEMIAAERHPSQVSEKEITSTIDKLSKIVLLPESETPTLSTITNTKALTENREFFQEAENGDIVLVYQQARKAYLYRPSTNKLINLAPINLATEPQGAAFSPSP